MKTIKLFGDLQAFKSEWSLNVVTVSEAMRAIEANRPGFIAAAEKQEYALVLVDTANEQLTRAVTYETVSAPWGNEELWVIPKIEGEVVAVGAAVVIAGFSIGVGSALAATLIALAINIALSIAISMVASLISGTSDGVDASATEAPENRPSYLFNGAVNTNRQGHRMPVIYGGPIKIGSMVLSADLYTKDIPV